MPMTGPLKSLVILIDWVHFNLHLVIYLDIKHETFGLNIDSNDINK